MNSDIANKDDWAARLKFDPQPLSPQASAALGQLAAYLAAISLGSPRLPEAALHAGLAAVAASARALAQGAQLAGAGDWSAALFGDLVQGSAVLICTHPASGQQLGFHLTRDLAIFLGSWAQVGAETDGHAACFACTDDNQLAFQTEQAELQVALVQAPAGLAWAARHDLALQPSKPLPDFLAVALRPGSAPPAPSPAATDGSSAVLPDAAWVAAVLPSVPVPPDHRCPACGRPAPQQARFCGHCGHGLAPRVCVHCGQPCTLGARYCGACGKARA